ncbi:MAG: DUF1684 domain-containing protein [Vicinamibacterales bacterium]
MRPLFSVLALSLAVAVAALTGPLASRMAERRGAVALLGLPVGPEYAREVAAWRAAHDVGVDDPATLSWFPVDEDYRVVASFVSFPTPRTLVVRVTDGGLTKVAAPGYLEFELERATFRLLPYWPATGDAMVIGFTDETNGTTSWREGRTLEAAFPGGRAAADAVARQAAEGALIPPIPIVLDFNRAVSLPCAHDPATVCPLPPADNNLAVEIRAGERDAGE